MAKKRESAQRSAHQLQPQEIEQLLITGEKPELLKAYFGEAQYEELRSLAQRASARAVRGGKRVILLPGLLGSTLGIKGGMFNDTIWFDPVSIVRGDLIKLTLKPPGKGVALGVIPLIYTRLRFWLWWYGFDVDYHFYDWRQSLDTLGQELKGVLDKEGDREVHLVAHSMGGVVARAALKAGAKNVEQLIMLGTPNGGSFVPVEALLGVASTVKAVAALDHQHDEEEIVNKMFNTFPGIYQLLPFRSYWNRLDLYDEKTWPKEGPRPRGALLKEAPAVQESLAAADDRFFLITGVNQETVTDVSKDNGEFKFTKTTQGDGTVPLDFARLAGTKTYYVEDTHTGMVGNGTVAAAVNDLLMSGATKRLPDSVPRTRDIRTREVKESELRKEEPFDGRQGHAITEAEQRDMVLSLLSPPGSAATLSSATSPSPGAVSGAPPAAVEVAPPFSGVVVGRRRQHRLDVELANGSIFDVEARAYVLGMFENVTPTGPAKILDEMMDNAVNEFVSRRMFSAAVGEVFMLPTGTHPVRADIALFAGLGHFDQFNDDVQKLVASNIIRTLIHAGIDEFATLLFGGGSGRSTGKTLENLISGFFEGLLDADTRHRFRRVILIEWDKSRYTDMKNQLYRLAGTPLFDDVEVTIDEIKLPPPVAREALPAAAEPTVLPAPEPAYLTLRHETDAVAGGRKKFLRASILTAGGKATVFSSVKQYDPEELDEQLEQLRDKQGLDLDVFGQELAKTVFDDNFRRLINDANLKEHPFVLVHDAIASRIPWETIKLGDYFPSIEGGISRRYMAENLAIAKWLEERRIGSTLDILLVVNPTGDLAGAEREGDVVQKAVEGLPSVRVVRRYRGEASRPTLLADFQSGEFDVIHYAGHAYFDETHPARSGILCAGKQVLSGEDLATLGNLPSLVFFNACESGRVRGETAKQPDKTVRDQLVESVSFAEAFLRGGIANFVGTYWSVDDAPAVSFAREFYTKVVSGQTIGNALLDGRKIVKELKTVDWADYIHYGSHEFRLKIR